MHIYICKYLYIKMYMDLSESSASELSGTGKGYARTWVLLEIAMQIRIRRIQHPICDRMNAIIYCSMAVAERRRKWRTGHSGQTEVWFLWQKANNQLEITVGEGGQLPQMPHKQLTNSVDKSNRKQIHTFMNTIHISYCFYVQMCLWVYL